MQLSDFTALSFDCYGTLIDWESGIAAVLVPWARQRGLRLGEEELLAAYAAEETRAEAAHPADPYPLILRRTMLSLGAALGAEVTAEDAQRLARSVPQWPPFADSGAALAALGQRYQLIILSNVDRASFAASQRSLGVSFTSVLTAEDVGSYKPSPRNFEALLAEATRLGVGEGGLLHVAQSLFHDHLPARRAGLRTVWINRRHGRRGWGATPPPPADVIPDWEFPSMTAFAAAAAFPVAGQPVLTAPGRSARPPAAAGTV